MRFHAAMFAGVLAVAAAPAAADEQVPFRGRDIGHFVVTPIGGPMVLTEDFTNGQATHLGAYSLVAQEDINLETLAVTNGSFTITAANGDTIHGTYAGQAQLGDRPGVIRYLVTGPIAGGTGRFEGATGTLTFDGVADLATLVLSETITGTISTPGSSAH